MSTAIEMVQREIACGSRPTFPLFHNMASTPRGVLCHGGQTGRTETLLPLPDTVERCAATRRVQHFLAPSGFEIRFPLRFVRIGVGFDLDMPLYWRVRFLHQDELSLRSIFFFFCGGKYPVPAPSGFEVFLLNPFGTFFWMPSYRPSP